MWEFANSQNGESGEDTHHYHESMSRYSKIISSVLESTPLCIILFNTKFENIMCNQQAINLFAMNSKAEYLRDFHQLSPEFQPDGRRSSEASDILLGKAFETGYCKFKWLHISSTGDEIPSEVTLIKLNIGDGEELVAGFVRDLRPELAGNDAEEWTDDIIFSQIPHKKLFEMVAELSSEWFFVLDNRTSQVQYFGKGREEFGLGGEKERFPNGLLERNIIHEDDFERFLKLSSDMKDGIFTPTDIRFIRRSGNTRYYRIISHAIYDAHQKPVFIVGKALDVDEQKNLEIRSKTDLLTGCYNKITSEVLISENITLDRNQHHVLFIIDIDNFKAINDNLGHHFGDLVLSEVANNLRSCFRNADVIGRIGGDEFIVFLKNISHKDVIEDKAKKIAEAFKNTYSGESKDYKISGSIGISRYPDDGVSYEELYKSADKALYQSKLKGKDCFTFYTKELLDGTMKNRTTLENANRIANSYFDSELVSTVFNLMYESRETNSSLNAVLQFIGKRTKSDRCYIFETFDGGKTYNNTYEWCNQGIGAEIQNLQGLTAEVLADFFNGSDENGIVYSNDLAVLIAEGAFELMDNQGILSFLHAQVKENDYVKLFIGLDDCTKTRVWNEKEINAVLYSAKMLSIFLKSADRVIPEIATAGEQS